METLLNQFYYKPLKHLFMLATDGDYREYYFKAQRLAFCQRYVEKKVSISGLDLLVPDVASFLSSYREIFVNKIYKFPWVNDSPAILDLGSNIGLSILFFKSLFPKSYILGLEADPVIFKYLKNNVYENGCSDVVLLNKAAWHKKELLSFSSDSADGGKVSKQKNSNSSVEGVDIASILSKKKFDFLKMDIEGAEKFVLPACGRFLNDISYIYIEYHSESGEPQALADILKILSDFKFRLHIYDVYSNVAPFMGLKLSSGFDLQLNIFGWK